MDILNHVKMPFALNSKQHIVGVDDVPNGDACGCFCLSCKTPVIAKHGNVLAHHFAHKVTAGFTEAICTCSPRVAVALIVLQEFKRLRSLVFNSEKYDISTHLQGNNYVDLVLKSEGGFTFGIKTKMAVPPSEYYAETDYLIAINTDRLAEDILLSGAFNLSVKQVFLHLLKNWSRYTHEIIKSKVTSPSTANLSVRKSETCICCNERPGKYGKGQLCEQCVNDYVGLLYPNITAMRVALLKS
jgi:hypothetical protein